MSQYQSLGEKGPNATPIAVEAIVLHDYDAREDQPGYLVAKAGDHVQILAPPESGHEGNKFKQYVYCSGQDDSVGWFPSELLSSHGHSATEAVSTYVVALHTSVAVKLEGYQYQAVTASLLSALFQDCSSGTRACFVYNTGLTFEFRGNTAQIIVDGVSAKDLYDWARLQLEHDTYCFGTRFVEWCTAQRSAESGFLEGDDTKVKDDFLDYLLQPGEHGVVQDRALKIYTWGKALRECAPSDSQFNFNAGVLTGRGGGANLRTMNGMSEEVQANVASCSLFPRWLEVVLHEVEHSTPPLHTISINCTKGRHRSVAAAELLKKYYYKNADIVHLTIEEAQARLL